MRLRLPPGVIIWLWFWYILGAVGFAPIQFVVTPLTGYKLSGTQLAGLLVITALLALLLVIVARARGLLDKFYGDIS